MHRLHRSLQVGLTLIILTLLSAVTLAQATPTVTVTPDSGDIGTSFEVGVSGLQANQGYTLEFVYVPDEAIVFSTTRTSDGSGNLSLSISTNNSDPAGAYRVDVRLNGEVIAQGNFDLTGGLPPTAQPPASSGRAQVQLIPTSGQAGAVFDVLVNGLNSGETVTVSVRYLVTDEEVYNRAWTANDSGRFDLKLFTTDEDGAGDYAVSVIASGGEVVGSAVFTISQPVGQNAIITVEPTAGANGTAFVISGRDLKPFGDLDVSVVNVETREVAFNTRIRATVDGTITLNFDSATASARAGDYNVVVREGDTVVGEAMLTITDGLAPEEQVNATVVVNPEVTTVGEAFTLEISGLAPDSEFKLNVYFEDDTTNPVYVTDRVADADGNFTINLGSNADDPAGAYSIVITQGGEVVGEADFTIQAAATQNDGSATVIVAPANGQPGDAHFITASGLTPDETVTVQVVAPDGTVIFEEARTADLNGSLALRFSTNSDTVNGDYTVRILRGDTPAGEAVLQVATPLDVATVTVIPPTAKAGSSHLITAAGLQPNETVVIDILFADEVVFSANRTADVNGVAVLSIVTETTDAIGDYTVRVRRGDTTVASGQLGITEPDAVVAPPEQPANDVTVSISPTSGEVGTNYTVDIAGLTPEELVIINVTLNGEVVFTTERIADTSGIARVIITSGEGDPAGVYGVDVVRSDQVIASADFEITGATTAQPTPAPFSGSVTVTPESGPIGTLHRVEVTGLTAGEEVTLQVLRGDTVIFRTQVIADDNGVALTGLQSDDTDEPGDYTVRAVRGDEVLSAATLTISDEQAPVDSVQVNVTPAAGPIGTSHAVSITGLQAGETVTINVLYAGQVDFSTERQADQQGAIQLNLIAAEGDPTGQYEIQVLRGSDLVATGTLTVDPVDVTDNVTPPQTVTPAGESEVIEGFLNADSPEQIFTFDGNAGELVIITMSSEAFDTYLYLIAPDGTEIGFNDDADGTDSIIGPLVLPQTGQYEVMASSFGFITGTDTIGGDFTLMIDRVVAQSLTVDAPVNATFNANQTEQTFTFTAEIGDLLSVSVNSDQTVDTLIELIDPTGQVVFFDDDGGDGFDPEMSRYAVTTDGTYLLRVAPFTSGDAGTVSVTLNQETARTLDGTGNTQTIRLNTKQTSDIVRMQGVAGESVSLSMTLVAGDASDVSVTVTQGDVTLMNYETLGLPQTITLGFVVPEDGTIAIIVESPESNGVIDLSITR